MKSLHTIALASALLALAAPFGALADTVTVGPDIYPPFIDDVLIHIQAPEGCLRPYLAVSWGGNTKAQVTYGDVLGEVRIEIPDGLNVANPGFSSWVAYGDLPCESKDQRWALVSLALYETRECSAPSLQTTVTNAGVVKSEVFCLDDHQPK